VIEVEIENFGPIRKIESPDNRIKINDLTLFIGPSNTGKSLLMKLLYAITDSVNDVVKDHTRQIPIIANSYVRNYILEVATSLGIENIQELLLDKDKLESFLYNYLSEILKDIKRTSEIKIRRIFYPETIRGKVRLVIDDLVVIEYDNGNVSVEVSQEQIKQIRKKLREIIEDINIEIKEKKDEKIIEISYRKGSLNIYMSRKGQPRRVDLTYIDALCHVVCIALREALSGELTRIRRPIGPIYLPAGRSFILERIDSLVSMRLARIYESESGGDLILDKMLWLITRSLDMYNISRRCRSTVERGEEKDVLMELISRVIQGDVEVIYDRELRRYQIFIKLEDKKIPIKNTSASIREVLPILLFKASELLNDIYAIFIEEPETELHPERQIDIARILAALTQEKLKVIASTHSDLILQELAILAKAYSLKKEERVKVIGDDIYIDPNKLSVYVFTREGVIFDWSENVRNIIKMGEIPYISDVLQKQLITILKITHQNSEYASART